MTQEVGGVIYMYDFPIVERLKRQRAILIPAGFYDSVQNFCERNFIEIEVNHYGEKMAVKKMCLACLKAFIVEQGARVYNSIDIIRLASKINSKIGHLNYYMDKGELKKVETHL